MPSPEPLLMFSPLSEFIADRKREYDEIPQQRRDALQTLADYVRLKQEAGMPAKLTFICTHNSRRSHLSQIWAKVAADSFRLDHVESFSGGTEATAFNPRAVDSLIRTGFKIETEFPPSSNPIYAVRYAENAAPLKCFSKVFDQEPNPTQGFAAIMTCSSADNACPVVNGCDLRVAIPYIDPKAADDTPAEAMTYDERSRQICREMLYCMSRV